MAGNFQRLLAADGSWKDFIKDWETQCEAFDEDFSMYTNGPLTVVKDVAETPECNTEAAVYAYHDGERFAAMCQVNCTYLPGYTGKVLRVRMLYLSPFYDFGDTSVDQYAAILTQLFLNIYNVSIIEMPSQHIKFHLRSPGDRVFFTMLGNHLDRSQVFGSVSVRGSWLYITKP